MDDARIPVHILIDAALLPLNGMGKYYYIRQRGEKNSGTILLKLDNLAGQCKLLTQQRNFDGAMEWVGALREELVDDHKAEEYITRAILRDSDLWVIEIEDREMNNPFVS